MNCILSAHEVLWEIPLIVNNDNYVHTSVLFRAITLRYNGSLVPRPSSLTCIVSHEEKVKYPTGGKGEEEEEEEIRERKAWEEASVMV